MSLSCSLLHIPCSRSQNPCTQDSLILQAARETFYTCINDNLGTEVIYHSVSVDGGLDLVLQSREGCLDDWRQGIREGNRERVRRTVWIHFHSVCSNGVSNRRIII